MNGFTIAGTGSALPAYRMTNDELSLVVDTSHEWISSRTGISERGLLRGGESLLDLTEAAARAALDQAGLSAGDIAAIIVATVTAPRLTPTLACDLQGRLGSEGYAFDISAACSGFVYALNVARGLMRVDPRPVLVVGAEELSKILDWTDRNTCVLFGDGAGAAVLVPSDNEVYIECRSLPDADDALTISGQPTTIRMDGKAIYRFAVKELGDVLRSACSQGGILPGDLDHVVAHQANIRIIEAAAGRLDTDLDKFFVNIASVGNTSAASVPIALDELNRSGRLSRGEKVGLVAFGGGLTSAAAVIDW